MQFIEAIRPRRPLKRALAGAVLALTALAPAAFGAIEFQEEYAKQIKAAETISPLTGDLFGDSVSLYTGAVEFSATDVTLPGNNALPVAFGRRFAIESRGEGATRFLLGDWDIDIPHISSVHIQGQGWKVDLGAGGASSLRCAGPQDPGQAAPPALDYGSPPAHWLPDEFWVAPTLYIPGRGSNAVLFANPNLTQPTATRELAKWSTKDNTFLYCTPLASGSAGQGDGFIARTSDGLAYKFDHMVTMPYASLIHRTGQTAARIVPREEARLYPTAVWDRHGNSVTYTWNGGQLQSIEATDGVGNSTRLLTFGYTAGKIATVSDQSRTWTYAYTSGQLSSVTLPDSSSWQFNLASVLSGDIRLVTQPPLNTPNGPYCNKMVDLQSGTANQRTATITHPSGATGTFVFDARRHGRTQVDDDCIQPDKNQPDYHYNRLPTRFDTLALVSKTISGAGIPTAYAWSYNYELVAGATTSMCGAGCTNSKTVEVTEPDGDRTVHTFGIRYGINEGQLLGTAFKNSAGTVLRSQAFTYANAGGTNFPFPANLGTVPYASRTDAFSAAQWHPQSQRSTTQDGATFSWTAQQFDTYARPTRESRLGLGFGLPLVNTTVYHDDTTFWVLGQVKTIHESYDTTSRIKLEKTYTAKSQVESEANWGFEQKRYTYNTDGTLATVSDKLGTAHATTLSDYYRGIPRLVTYIDGKTESATVNNLGQILTVSDEQGYTASYTYHPTSYKLQTVSPPSGDTIAWASTNYALDRVTTSEYGLTGTHWRRTVTTGNRNTVTYYDAMFRPVLVREWDAATPSTVKHSVTRYDSDNRAVFSSVPLASLPSNSYLLASQGTDSSYDPLGRPVAVSTDSEIGTLTTSYQYLSGFQRRVTNPRGYSTTSTFDGWDEPTYEHPRVITGEDGVTTSIIRTIFGFPYSVSRSGTYNGSTQTVQRRYVYDDYMRLCKTIEPEGGGSIIEYNVVGDVFWTAPTGAATSIVNCQRDTATDKSTHIYNARRRLLGVIRPAGTDGYTQSYDPDGALKTIEGSGTTWTYEYNKRRLLEKETLAVDGKTFVFDWAYDTQGAVASLTYPDGTFVDYAPDAFGRATKVGAYASGVKYHLHDAIAEFTYANGIKHEMTPNDRLLPRLSSDMLGTAPILNFEYAYDANGNVDTIEDYAQNGLNSKTLTYDKFDRLTVASAPSPSDSGSFTYDPADNLRSMTVGTRVYAYAIDAATNRVSGFTENGANAKALTYDARGNVASKGSQAFSFDAANRLLSVTAAPGGSGSEAYVYDGHNRRVSIQKSGETGKRYSVYSQGGQLLHEVDKAGMQTNYVYLGGTLLARGSQGNPPPPVPATPTGLAANPNPSATGNYTVSWNSTANAATYQLEERNGTTWTSVQSTAATSWPASGKPSGGYRYRVRACNSASVCSATSAELQVNVNIITAPPPPNPISVIGDPNAPGVYNRFAIDWTESAGATSYKLFEEVAGGGWTVLFTSTNVTIWSTPSPRVDGTYRFKAQACNGTLCSPDSDVVTKTITTDIIIPPPPSPIRVGPNPSEDGNYAVTWEASAGAHYYKVHEVANGQPSGYANVGNVTSWSLAAKPNGTYDYYAVACILNSGIERCSAPSATVTEIVSRPNIPAAPEWIKILADGVPPDSSTSQVICDGQSTRGFTVQWAASAGATAYNLRESNSVQPNATTTSHGGSVTSVALTRSRIPPVTSTSYSYEVQACNGALCSGWRGIPEICVGNDELFNEVVTTVTYYHTDALGSPAAETNSSGGIVKRSRYEPYGAPTTGVFENGPGYTGHMTDSLSRLSYMQQRYYDPALGRFLSVDPVASGRNGNDNFNRYWYGNNTPYKFIDPDGRAVALAGSDENKKEFQSISFRLTGYKVKEEGGRLAIDGARNEKVGSPVAAKALSEAVKSERAIDVSVVKNDPGTFVDSFEKKTFDVGDFDVLSGMSESLGAALYAHVF
ncbi:MAG TPA: RHS repeat-associated core domain-containing protein, partial [Tahibacter sp.]|nr:RHS repeat-associated core domain-containing protein [Tahibacter sp.]